MNSPDIDTAANNCLELSNQAYAVLVDAISTRNKRTLDNAKTVCDIVLRPYPQTLEGAVRENFDRAQQIVSLTVNELQTTSRRATEITTSLVENAAKLQVAWLQYVRSMMVAGLPTAGAAKPAANGATEPVKPVGEMTPPSAPVNGTNESAKPVAEKPRSAPTVTGTSEPAKPIAEKPRTPAAATN